MIVRVHLLLPALCLAFPAVAQEKSVGDREKPIVVTGVRTPDLQAKLAKCIARQCPPNQEIDAALAVAENQFIDGKCGDARKTLLKSIGRNKRYAKEYPEPVSDLLRANYRVAEHLGDSESYRIGAFDTVSALKAGLPDDDRRVLGAEVEVGDMYARLGRLDEAIDKYADIERRAAKLGLYNVQGMAHLRTALLYSQLATRAPAEYKSQARKTAKWLIDNPDPHLQPFGQAARVLMARLDAKTGDPAAMDKLIADFPTNAGNSPVLLYMPPITPLSEQQVGPLDNNVLVQKTAKLNYDGDWIDVGFWVTPDGRVNDVDIMRTGKGDDRPPWAKPILTAIGGRRYAPLKMDAAQPGIFRVERYTLTAWLTTVTGSRIRVREAQPRIQMLDLSAEPPANVTGS